MVRDIHLCKVERYGTDWNRKLLRKAVSRTIYVGEDGSFANRLAHHSPVYAAAGWYRPTAYILVTVHLAGSEVLCERRAWQMVHAIERT